MSQDFIKFILERAAESHDVDLKRLLYSYVSNPLYTFEPQPDNLPMNHQQNSFMEEQFPGLAVVLGG